MNLKLETDWRISERILGRTVAASDGQWAQSDFGQIRPTPNQFDILAHLSHLLACYWLMVWVFWLFNQDHFTNLC